MSRLTKRTFSGYLADTKWGKIAFFFLSGVQWGEKQQVSGTLGFNLALLSALSLPYIHTGSEKAPERTVTSPSTPQQGSSGNSLWEWIMVRTI